MILQIFQMYRGILDVKRVFFSGNRKPLFDTTVTDFEREKDTVLAVNIGVITGLESKLAAILLLLNEMNRKTLLLS